MSSTNAIPAHVHRFILDHIVSVEQLEILLLLRGRRDRDWNAEEVARELRTAALSAANRLADLERRGLLTREGERYRFDPAAPALEEAVEGLSHVYPERRVTVIDLIFSKPNDVIRTFADAFKLRKDT